MNLMYTALIAMTVLISVPYSLQADALEMKYVPFWWSTDPLTGEAVYTDYFKETSSVHKEHTTYLASIAVVPSSSNFTPSVMLEVERAGMIEEITYEYQYIQVRDSAFDHGPFANPDYTIRELVAISTWVEAPVPVVVEEITEVITEITTESVTDITAIITGITGEEPVVEVTEEPPIRVSNNKGTTHWDVNDAEYAGSNSMSSQEFKDMKKKQAEWKAYETASKLYPTLYPAYVHEEVVVVEDKVVVPLYESKVIINVEPEVILPSVTSSAVVVPIPEPIVEPTPVPGVSSSVVVPERAVVEPTPVPGVSSSVVVPVPESIVPSIVLPDDFVIPGPLE